jgi:hypothetical protein
MEVVKHILLRDWEAQRAILKRAALRSSTERALHDKAQRTEIGNHSA